MKQAAEVSDLSQRGPHAVDPDDHVERRLRQGDRQHARRPPPGRAVCARAPIRCTAATARRHPAAASVAKIPVSRRQDGISLTVSLVPKGWAASPTIDHQSHRMLDAFFGSTGYHMNVNVLNRETLLDAMDHPEKYPSLTIRVSGYAVNFVRLTREQQMDDDQPDLPRRRLA